MFRSGAIEESAMSNPSESVRKSLAGLRTAIETEIGGLEFFKTAAERCDDPAGKEMFLSLAREEIEHKRLLEMEFQSLLAKGRFLPHEVVTREFPLEETAIPVEAFRRSLERSHFEMSAVGIGILLEKNAIAHFERMAEETDDEEARKTFRWLAAWERGHLDTLAELDRALRDAYWADQGFAPM
jgi:rubrerythrin